MMLKTPTARGAARRDATERRIALVTAIGLLLMALLAPFAQFGVLETLIVPTDAAATMTNIAASMGLFQAAIVAFLIVAILDVVVAWGFYVLLRPVDERLARVVGSLRVVYGAFFALALISLVDAARVVGDATGSAVQAGPLQDQVAASVASFDRTWHVALGIFGVHLVGLGALLIRSTIPRLLAALVVVAGLGYLADAIGTLLVPGYQLTISTVTFVGEALLIIWLFRFATRGPRSSAADVATRAGTSAAVAS